MDRNRKRKAGADDSVNGTSKRQKLPASETPQNTSGFGLQLIHQLKNAKDKTGRSITTLFLTLPNKRELPDYYEAIKLPIAIDTVEAKLRRNGYPTLTTVESDVKRMVANAKAYNDERSEVFQDAERVRKLLSNWMKVHNPAYQDPEYAAFPTPIPGERDTKSATPKAPNVVKREGSERPRKPTITLSRGRKPSPPPEAATPEVSGEEEDFDGKSFQQAQEQIIEEILKYTDDEGLQIYAPFANLPSRTLVDYYQLIKRPVSLKAVAKRIRGQHGRETPSGVSDFKTWDAFEEELSYVWHNARDYNEDGSSMYELAGEFEEHVKRRLAAAKAVIDEPQGPRISLKARPKPVLHLGAKASPAQSSTPGVGVDNDALVRQKQLVKGAANGHQTPQPQQSTASRSSSQVPAPAAAERPQSGKGISPPAVKLEKSVGPSPALSTARVTSIGPETRQTPQPTAAMPPPPRVPSASPLPQQQAPTTSIVPPSIPAPPTFIDNFSRTKPVAEALLTNLHISTHPQLNLSKPFAIDIPPSKEYTQQSLTTILPSSHFYLQLTPTVSHQLSAGRQYKLFVTVNGVRVTPSSRPVPQPNGDGLGLNGTTQPLLQEKKQVYDAPLNVGVNRVEVEVVAVTGRGGGLEMEKVNVFADLLRA